MCAIAKTIGVNPHGCDLAPINPSNLDIEAAIAEKTLAQDALRKWLKSTHITVYRGVDTAARYGHHSVAPENTPYQLLPVRTLSSWTTDRKWASTLLLYRRQVPITQLLIGERTFPLDRVAAWSPLSSGLSPPEQEVVIMSKNNLERLDTYTIGGSYDEQKEYAEVIRARRGSHRI